MFKRPVSWIFALALALVLMLSYMVGSYASARSFPDVSGHWGESYIAALVEKGAISGMPDGKFYPDDTVTFAQLVTMIIRREYGDIDPVGDHWASGYLQKASEIGLLEIESDIDYQESDFSLGITRYDTAAIIRNALMLIYGEAEEPETDIVVLFEDYPSCKSCRASFQENVGQVYLKGIMGGKPGPIFDGEATLTRAEASVTILKLIDPSYRTPPEII